MTVPLTMSFVLILAGCKARNPDTWETRMMTSVEHRVFVGNKKVRNPLLATSENIAEGRQTFSYYCVVCHGLDGQNTGVPFAEKMSPPVANLAMQDIQNYTDGQLHWIIQNGIRMSGMPGWSGLLEDTEMWQIVRYIRHLPAKGSTGVPAVYAQESKEHARAHDTHGRHHQ